MNHLKFRSCDSSRFSVRFRLLLMLFLVAGSILKLNAQTYQAATKGRIIVQTTAGDKHFTTDYIYANIFLDQELLSFRCKSTVFLQPGIPVEDSVMFATLFNASSKPVIEFAGRLPQGYKVNKDGKSRKVTLEGILEIGGIKKPMSFEIMLSVSPSGQISYSLDKMVDVRSWGLVVPQKLSYKVLSTARLQFNN